ncbi:pyocin knob domain-containing protein [Enterococcus casseliflavus]|uniref:pyocin knob domain-containing protein n=1 Tax=Enterococcus casseliflavus TaxID=37734 RepID=UPI003EE0347C
MVKQWRNEDIIAPTDAQRWEDGVDKSLKENVQNAGDLKKHAEDKSNPHNVTAAQTGAYSKSEADDKLTTSLARKTNVRGYSNGTVTAANGMDLNDMTESGTFMGSNMLNTPDGTGATSNWWFVTCMVHNNLYQTQIAYFFTGTITQQWQRNNRNGVWQSWKRIANIDDNVASATKLQTARTINGVAFDGTKNIEIKSEPQVDEIPANSNLNNFKSAGFYGCRLSATAGTISNTPSNVAFSMVVINAGNDSIVTQILSEFNIPAGSKVYIRRCYNNSWGSWFPIATADGTLQSGLFSQSASRLATARTISLSGGVTGSTTFDGSGNATIAATLAGNAPSATRLATARKIAGVDFDGTRDIAISAGNVGAYTKVEIDGKFDDISVATRNYLFDTHIERTGRNEFLNDPSWNLAPLIDEYGMDREYTVSFDLKSAIAGTIQVYSQNGSAARYDIGRHSLSATTEYQRFSITFKPEKAGSFDTETRSLLAFFGTYGTGRIPTVRNVMFGLGNAGGDWLPNPDELAKQLALEETDKRIETLEKNTIRLTNQFPDPDFQKREPRPFNEGNFAMTYDANGVVLNNTTATKGRVYWATPPLSLAIGRTYNVAMFVNTDAASWGKEIEVGTGSGENLKFTLTNNSPVWIQGTIKLTTFAAFSIWLEPATVLRIRELHIYEANTDITTARIEQLEKEIERLSKDNSLPPVVPIFASGFSNYNPNPGASNYCCVERRGDWVELGGAIVNANAFTINHDEQVVATIPVGYRPKKRITRTMPGSGVTIFNLHIDPDGRVMVSRYRGSNSGMATTETPVGAWLNTRATWIGEDR